MKIKNISKILISSLCIAFLLSACDYEVDRTGGTPPGPGPAPTPTPTPLIKYKAINITVQSRTMAPLITDKASAYGLLKSGSQELISSGLK